MNVKSKKLNKVAGYRAMIGKTQAEVGEYLGISKQSYSNKERGQRNFNDEEKLKLKELFSNYIPDITIDSIFF